MKDCKSMSGFIEYHDGLTMSAMGMGCRNDGRTTESTPNPFQISKSAQNEAHLIKREVQGY